MQKYLSIIASIVLAAWFMAPAMAAATGVATQYAPLLERLTEEGFETERLQSLFVGVDYNPAAMGKKMRALYRTKYLPRTPSPKKPSGKPLTIYDTWLTPEKQKALAAFKERHKSTLDAAEKRYGVDAEVIVAVIMVETRLGTFLGNETPLETLASMAASVQYADIAEYFAEYEVTEKQLEWMETRQQDKADWAYKELKALLSYTEANALDLSTMSCSIYGAIGICQFMPTNALTLGADGDGDGKVDLFSPEDAIHSVARFLKKNGWKDTLKYSRKIRVLMRYNPDKLYAGTVLAIAKRI